MSTTSNQFFFFVRLVHRALLGAAAFALVSMAPLATAQTPLTPLTPMPAANFLATNLDPQLPDSPSFVTSSLTSSSISATDTPEDPDGPQTTPGVSSPNARTKHSPHLQMTISPNEIAEPMSVHDKVVGGLKDSVSLFSASGWFVSAGWEQLTNGSPNFGTDKGAFGQRLGASVIRNVSEGIFSDCFFAPVFHEDPRYYIMGRGNNFFKRAFYAATRTIITRTDSGRTTPNFSLLAGNAAGAALTVTYYPSKNTTFSEVAQTFGGSVGGSAIGFVVTEFVADALEYVHLKKRD